MTGTGPGLRLAALLATVILAGLTPAVPVPGTVHPADSAVTQSAPVRPAVYRAPGSATPGSTVHGASARIPAVASRAPATGAREPAVTHREERIDTPAGPVTTDVVVADLTAPGVRATLLTGAAVGERATVAEHADRAGAAAAVNGDFFDLGRSNAPAGPSVRDGRALTSAVPPGRRLAPAVPGALPGDVLAVDAGGTARLDRLTLDAAVRGPIGTLPVDTLNAYAVPQDGIGLITPDWGGTDRNATLCGSDTDRDAPCAADRIEVAVVDGRVTAVRPPGAGPVGPGESILVGRDRGAAALRELAPGDPLRVRYRLAAGSGVAPRTAVGGSPILRDGAPVPGLDDAARDPRSAAGVTADGRLVLATADGRESTSAGATLAETAQLLRRAGAVDGVNLDGGGSSTLAFRPPGADRVQVVNAPSEDAYRLVPNALGVLSSGGLSSGDR
ncbi:phosphodiester glycosidase family protein [Pseudonocardia nantongensis]|uniref:phosphodiester glycosidase family protein n=1 Tax=Pseudonocardia nantongensis TaxID=1181885 RepID=UPI00397B4F22